MRSCGWWWDKDKAIYDGHGSDRRDFCARKLSPVVESSILGAVDIFLCISGKHLSMQVGLWFHGQRFVRAEGEAGTNSYQCVRTGKQPLLRLMRLVVEKPPYGKSHRGSFACMFCF